MSSSTEECILFVPGRLVHRAALILKVTQFTCKIGFNNYVADNNRNMSQIKVDVWSRGPC